MVKRKPMEQRQRVTRPTCIGILTSGGDCQGLNAAIRGVAKAAIGYGMDVIGIMDGFRGLIENRTHRLDDDELSGILTLGGTILGTSRDKPDKFQVGDKILDMTGQAVENYRRLHLDCLVCLGGGGTQKNALKLVKRSDDVRVITLPKTIDNDVAETEVTFGFDTAVQIATEAIDRLHSTASSHHRVMVLEVMGHNTGWLAAAAGLAGGADVVLLPEIPYSPDVVVQHLIQRRRKGKKFSIVVIAEGALTTTETATVNAQRMAREEAKLKSGKGGKKSKKGKGAKGYDGIPGIDSKPAGVKLARTIEEHTGLQSRLTTLGHVQRGGTPSAFDRILASKLGTKTAELIADGQHGVMVAVKGDTLVTVPLEQVAGKRKPVAADHPMLQSLRALSICLGEEL